MTPVGVLFNGSMWGIVYGDHSNIMKLNSALVLTELLSISDDYTCANVYL